MSINIRRLLAALTLVGVLGGVAAATEACATNPDPVVYEPAAWGPTMPNGWIYCGYWYTPLECDGHPGIPYQFPTAGPAPSMTDYLVAHAVWTYLLANDDYLYGYGYYDTIIAPRHFPSTVVVVTRDRFVSTGTTFVHTHQSEHAQAVKEYPPKYKDPKNGKVYTGDKYAKAASDNSNIVTQKTRKGGGNAGAVADPAKATTGNQRSSDHGDAATTRKATTSPPPPPPSMRRK
jgi:hypothetical protein